MPTNTPTSTPPSFNEALVATANVSGGVVKRRKAPLSADSPLPKVFELNKGFTIGCDPEGFLFDKERKVYVPATGIIPGTKYEPHPVDKGAIQVDGMAVEFNIEPVSTYEEFETNITTVIKQLESALPKNLEIHWVPSVKFSEEDFDKAPDSAKELGCQPDFNGWNGEVNPPPQFEDPYVRCAGGHLHVGFPDTKNEDVTNQQHVMNCQDLVQQFDWFLGAWSAIEDKDSVRRKLYGKMGACRYKPYGVEYRVLSNFWVGSEALRLQVWNRMCCAISNMNRVFIPERVSNGFTQMLKNMINEHEVTHDFLNSAKFPVLTLDTNYCRI